MSKWKSSKKSAGEKSKKSGKEKSRKKSRKEKPGREELDGAESAVKVKTEKQH